MRRVLAGAAAAALVLPLPLLHAQQQSRVAGTVRSRATGAPVAGAEVAIPSLGRVVRSASNGAYELRDLPGGSLEVVARQIGYAAQRRAVVLTGTDRAVVDFTLDAARDTPTVLPEVPVTGEAALPRSAKRSEFERRRAAGVGHFILPEELEKQRNRQLSDVLRKVPGLRIARVTTSYPPKYVAITGRGTASLQGLRASHSFCLVQIYLDGVRVAGDGLEPQNLNEFSVSELSAIEYYAGPSRTPAELNVTGSACGTLVLWTK